MELTDRGTDYLVLPLLFFFVRQSKAIWFLVAFWLLAVAFAHHSFDKQTMNLAVAAPFFLTGVMAYVGFAKRRNKLPGWVFIVFFAVIVWSGGQVDGWIAASIPCLALGLALPFFKQIQSRVLTRTSWHIARYSYGIYLLHPFSLWLGFDLCRSQSLFLQFTVVLVSVAVFSFAAYHLIEAPFVRLGPRLSAAVQRRRFA